MIEVPSARPPRVLTVIIHGTAAHAETWWRPGEKFAQALERSLAERGMPGTVWAADLLGSGRAVHWFTWSGRNEDADRRRGGWRLARGLTRTAARAGATAAAPLVVNVVAHSHGGNVALEALRHLPAEVRLGRLVLLGTPLYCSSPAYRGAQLLVPVLSLLIALGSLAYLCMLPLLFLLGWMHPAALSHWKPDALHLLALAAGGFAGGPAAAWALRRLERLWVGVRYRWGRVPEEPVYGPSLARLRECIGTRPIVLISAMDDEAALLLEACGAPERVLPELLARLGGTGRVLRVLFGPWIRQLVFPLAELLLEKFTLGMPWREILVRKDYCLAFCDGAPADGIRSCVLSLGGHRDGRSGFDRRIGDRRGERDRRGPTVEVASEAESDLARQLRRQTPHLWGRMQSAAAFLRSQVQMRHSLYYRNQAVIDLIASQIVMGAAPVGAVAGERRAAQG